MAEQWEYQVLTVGWPAWRSGATQSDLNRLGQQGWEVASVGWLNSEITILLKRRKS